MTKPKFFMALGPELLSFTVLPVLFIKIQSHKMVKEDPCQLLLIIYSSACCIKGQIIS